MEVDHIVPRAIGGKDEYKNLQLLHRHCHDVIATAKAVKSLCEAQLPLHPARLSNLISCLRIQLFNHDQHRSILLRSGE